MPAFHQQNGSAAEDTRLPTPGQSMSSSRDGHREIDPSTSFTDQNPLHATSSHDQSQIGLGAGALTNLSNLVCDVARTTGREPPALVGASTTIVGDRLYVFGGRRLSRKRPQLTQHLYELDLVSRHWTRLHTGGTAPVPRYFHSMCALGDTKLVCYGGMAPAPATADSPDQPDRGIVVMSDVHIYDIATRKWTSIAASNPPPGRYAHCATVLPSTGIFTSASAALSALHHNPSSSNPNQGSLGVAIDGSGGAEMIVIGGQDSGSNYISQISVFNLRSLQWTSIDKFNRECGAYRSVVAHIPAGDATRIGSGSLKPNDNVDEPDGYATLLYSNYNFLDVKLELQIRTPDGELIEKPMTKGNSPPGLRFPNGGIVNGHFIISGTFLTSSKQEYALWALELSSMTWFRIDVGGSLFSAGSWNRGIAWHTRNKFIVLGDLDRKLAEDYNHRRINFKHICFVELEAFGLYDNPRVARLNPTDTRTLGQAVLDKADTKPLSAVSAKNLGRFAAETREIADMEIVAIAGERVPVNSHVLSRRWGACFAALLRTSALMSEDSSEVSTIRQGAAAHPARSSSMNTAAAALRMAVDGRPVSTVTSNGTITASDASTGGAGVSFKRADSRSSVLMPSMRPRQLFLPHTYLTVRALVYYFYVSTLPPPESPFCTYQILCSLLQIARPYQIDGLVEATVERLHEILDPRSTAAVFNAAAMAAGGGLAAAFDDIGPSQQSEITRYRRPLAGPGADDEQTQSESDLEPPNSASTTSSTSTLEEDTESDEGVEVWRGGVNVVAGLQKRGLRGLMEGRRLRERGSSEPAQIASIAGLGAVT